MKKILVFIGLFLLSGFSVAKTVLLLSTSLPDPLLDQYVRQASMYHIPLVLRGFVNNRYPDTFNRINKILHPSKEVLLRSGFEINPLYFRRFEVIAVPSLVVFDNEDYSKVSGNIAIKKSLSIISQKSGNKKLREKASILLETKHDAL